MASDSMSMAAVIMAGGIGTRFWPLSTDKRPKQFLDLFGDGSLLEKCRRRLDGLLPPERIIVLTNRDFVHLVREQLPDLPRENIIAEPMRRDTAAAVCLGALILKRHFESPVMAVFPADHLIEPAEAFRRTVSSAARQAAGSKALYTIGIPPRHPSTAFGYLELGPEIHWDGNECHYRIEAFREKPDRTVAEAYLASGRHLWNAGIFVWSTEAILRAFERHLPDHPKRLAEAAGLWPGAGFGQALQEAFQELTPISVDYAIMEKAGDVRCVKAGFDWSDVGSWSALHEHLPGDGNDNRGRGGIQAVDSEGNLIFCEDAGETVTLIGVRGLAVVRMGKQTLIVPRERAEEVRQLNGSKETSRNGEGQGKTR